MLKIWTLGKAYSCNKLRSQILCIISDSTKSICIRRRTLEMNWCSHAFTFHLMFAGCTVVQSSARPCVLPGPSGAARRSRHHPWDQEPCCAAPPVCPGPVARTNIVWHNVFLFQLEICLSVYVVLKLCYFKHLHAIFTGASTACLPASWESYHTVPPLVRGLGWALVQVFSPRRVAWCSL